MNCKQAEDLLLTGIPNDQGDAGRLRDHCGGCPACARLAAELRGIDQALASALGGRKVAANFEACVWKRIQAASHQGMAASASPVPPTPLDGASRWEHSRMVLDVIGAAGVAIAVVAATADCLVSVTPAAGELLHRALAGPMVLLAIGAAAIVALALRRRCDRRRLTAC